MFWFTCTFTSVTNVSARVNAKTFPAGAYATAMCHLRGLRLIHRGRERGNQRAASLGVVSGAELWPLTFAFFECEGGHGQHNAFPPASERSRCVAPRSFRTVISNLAGGFGSRRVRSNAWPRTWTYITLPEGCYVKIIPGSLFVTAWDDIKMLSLSWKDRLLDVSRCVTAKQHPEPKEKQRKNVGMERNYVH